MIVKLTRDVTMYSGPNGPQTFTMGTELEVTPLSLTMFKTAYGYLYRDDCVAVAFSTEDDT